MKQTLWGTFNLLAVVFTGFAVGSRFGWDAGVAAGLALWALMPIQRDY